MFRRYDQLFAREWTRGPAREGKHAVTTILGRSLDMPDSTQAYELFTIFVQRRSLFCGDGTDDHSVLITLYSLQYEVEYAR